MRKKNAQASTLQSEIDSKREYIKQFAHVDFKQPVPKQSASARLKDMITSGSRALRGKSEEKKPKTLSRSHKASSDTLSRCKSVMSNITHSLLALKSLQSLESLKVMALLQMHLLSCPTVNYAFMQRNNKKIWKE